MPDTEELMECWVVWQYLQYVIVKKKKMFTKKKKKSIKMIQKLCDEKGKELPCLFYRKGKEWAWSVSLEVRRCGEDTC